MPEPPFPRVPPGGVLPARELNRATSAVEALTRITGAGGLTVTQGPAGPLVEDPRGQAIEAVLTADRGGGYYAGIELVNVPGQAWLNGPLVFDTAGMPLYQINAASGLPAGTRVRAWPSLAGDCYLFETAAARAASAPCPAFSWTEVSDVCPTKSGGNVTDIEVEYTQYTYDPTTCQLTSRTWCVTNPTGCCTHDHCDCDATDFLVFGTGFTGPFTGFACEASSPCCGGTLPRLLCVDIGTAANRTLYATAVEASWRTTTSGLLLGSGGSWHFDWEPYKGESWYHYTTGFPAAPTPPCTPGSTAVLGVYGDIACNGVDPGGGWAIVQGLSVAAVSDCSLGGGRFYDNSLYAGNWSLVSYQCDPFEVVFDLLMSDPDAGPIRITFYDCGLSSAASPSGFNDIFDLGLQTQGVYTFACGDNTITIQIGDNCLATLTFTTAGGDTAQYVFDVTDGCCQTFTATLLDTTSPGNAPATIEVQGLGCESGSGSLPGDQYWCVALTSSGENPLCYSGCYPASAFNVSIGTPPLAVGSHVSWSPGGGIICNGVVTSGPYAEPTCGGDCETSGGGVAVVSLKSGHSTGSATSYSLTGVNALAGMLVVVVGVDSTTAVGITVTFGGTPMTLATGTATTPSGTGPATAVYYLHLSAATSGTVVATLPSGVAPISVAALSVTGLVYNAFEHGDGSTDASGTTNPTLTAIPTDPTVYNAAIAFFYFVTPAGSGAWVAPFVSDGIDTSDGSFTLSAGSEVVQANTFASELSFAGAKPAAWSGSVVSFK